VGWGVSKKKKRVAANGLDEVLCAASGDIRLHRKHAIERKRLGNAKPIRGAERGGITVVERKGGKKKDLTRRGKRKPSWENATEDPQPQKCRAHLLAEKKAAPKRALIREARRRYRLQLGVMKISDGAGLGTCFVQKDGALVQTICKKKWKRCWALTAVAHAKLSEWKRKTSCSRDNVERRSTGNRPFQKRIFELVTGGRGTCRSSRHRPFWKIPTGRAGQSREPRQQL